MVVLDSKIRLNINLTDIFGRTHSRRLTARAQRAMKCYKRDVSHLPHRAQTRASEADAFAYTVLLVVSYAMTSERISAYAREPRSSLISRIGM